MGKLLKSYLKRDKIGIITVAILSVLAIFLMIIGMSISVNVEGIYEDKVKKLGDYHTICFYEDIALTKDVYNELIYNQLDKNLAKIDRFSEIYLQDIKINFYRKDSSGWQLGGYLQNADILKNKIHKQTKKGYYPLWMDKWHADYWNVVVGDTMSFNLAGKRYNFEIVQLVERVSTLYATQMLFIENEIFQSIAQLGKENNVIMHTGLGFTLNEPNEENVKKIGMDIYEATVAVNGLYSAIYSLLGAEFNVTSGLFIAEYTLAKQASHPYIKLLGIALIAFSILVVAISVIALAFIINTSVNADVKNIGVLKALGYTTGDLRKSYMLLYATIIGLSIIIGVVLSVCLMPTFVNIITMMANLIFEIPVFVPAIFIAIALVFGAVILTVYFATKRIGFVTPISALRKNISTHSFRKNRVPLDKTKGNVNVALGLKSVFNNIRQSGVIFTMVTIMCILLSFVSVVFYNLNVNQQAMINLSGMEYCDSVMAFADSADPKIYDEVLKTLKADDRVQNINISNNWQFKLGEKYDNQFIYSESVSDYNSLRTNMLYKGRYPENKNEVVINYAFTQKYGLEIGDSIDVLIPITINMGDKGIEKTFVIVGISQAINSSKMLLVSNELHKEIYDYVKTNYPQLTSLIGLGDILVYLQPEYLSGEKWKEFFFDYQRLACRLEGKEINDGKEVWSESLFIHSGFDNIYQTVLSVAAPACDALTKIFFIVSALIILLLMAMIMKIKVMKEGEDYAILKALGYTSSNIMLSISLSMLLVSLVGGFIGCLIGALTANPLLDAFAKGLGVAQMGFIVNWWYILAVFVIINFLVFAISMLLSLRVRKISPVKMLKSE